MDTEYFGVESTYNLPSPAATIASSDLDFELSLFHNLSFLDVVGYPNAGE
jgi:hypothetical protein